jgi:glucose/arabinose dehydrogenase
MVATVPGAAVLVTSPPNDSRLFVVEQHGLVHIIENGVVNPTPFLDLSGPNGGPVDDTTSEEAGLLGMVFDPDFATNGEFYVFYTTLLFGAGDNDPADTLARFHVSADPNVSEPTGTVVLQLPRSRPNHNGGMIEFGADGFLYAGTGDGGSHGDPFRYAQDPHSLFGKMLRIDVRHHQPDKQYDIPADNPFADGTAGAPEVYDLGLRNPWRWSFDRATNDLWIGDVGQGVTEEIDVVAAGAQAGLNFGWSAYEGNACCATQADLCTQDMPQQACDPTGKTFAQDNRAHADGWAAIIGGQVYRGACYPDLVGWYFYTDNVRGGLYKARLKSDNSLEIVDLEGSFPMGPTSLHADSTGELYETDINGNVWHLEASL